MGEASTGPLKRSGAAAKQSDNQAGRAAGRPSAPSVSLVRTQSPRWAVCTVMDSGRPGRRH